MVDIAAGYKDVKLTKPYPRDSLQTVYSTSKGLCTIAIAILVDRGLLNYNDTIAKHWPNFAQGNKENVTISDLLQHKSGVSYFESGKKITKELVADFDKLAEFLEKEPHIFNGEKKLAYHLLNFGHYMNEIVRRVDPKKRTLHYFIKEEIADPLEIDFKFLLTKEEFEERYAPFLHYPYLHLVFNTFLKLAFYQPLRKYLGYNQTLSHLRHYITNQSAMFCRANSIYDKDYILGYPNDYETYTFEFPGFNMVTNARSLGKLSGLIANGGKLEDGGKTVRLFKEETIELMLQVNKEFVEYDHILEQQSHIKPYGGLGFFSKRNNPFLRGNANFFGWSGFGGSHFMFNTDYDIGMGYVMNAGGDPGLGIDPRGLNMYNIVYEIIEEMSDKEVKDVIKNMKFK